MTKKEEASGEALGELKKSSVYDFLYHDTRRVGSYLAQFDDFGHLQQIKETESAGESLANKGSFIGGGGVPLIASGKLNIERAWSSDGRDISERIYDSLWTNAITFLDFLAEHNLIIRDISGARIGQFVLFEGLLNIVDISMFKGMWEVASIREAIFDAINQEAKAGDSNEKSPRPERRRIEKSNKARPEKSPQHKQIEAGFDFLKFLPHSLQARMVDDNARITWSSLKEESMVMSGSDIFLGHGSAVSGRWNLLGILDSLPKKTDASSVREDFSRKLAMHGSAFAELVDRMIPVANVMGLGRPPHAYGITPLLIFRNVAAAE